MTGYITTYEPYVEDYGGNLIEWGKVQFVWAIIEDSERIGDYARPLAAMTNDTELTDALVSCTSPSYLPQLISKLHE
jgi:hypothetical protein